MWLLLKEEIPKDFEIKGNPTYLFKIDKTNFLIGKNNSGKSYFLRFLLKNTVEIYDNNEKLEKEMKEVLQMSTCNLDIDFFQDSNNDKLKPICDKYKKFIDVINKANSSKKDTGTKIYPDIRIYKFDDEVSLLKEMQSLFQFLDIKSKPTAREISEKIIFREKDVLNKILTAFKMEIADNIISILTDEDIMKLGIKMKGMTKNKKVQKYYFPILRSIRHPLKIVGDIDDESYKEEKRNIYKERINSEYNFDSEINIVTGLDFYKEYKRNLLGTREKRDKVNKFEAFLGEYFFNGEKVSIIPDEDTYELKININNKEDRFIYEVGDGITSLLIIMYTIFMECNENENKLFFIEEPENNFHPGFQRLFINMITYFKDFKNCFFYNSYAFKSFN